MKEKEENTQTVKIGKHEFESMKALSERLKIPIEETEKLVRIYKDTENREFDLSPKKDENGNLILPEGTLIHGVKYYNRLTDVADEGLLAGALLKDTPGDYGVNGWKVDHEQTMKEFYDDYNSPKNRGPRIAAVNNETGEVVKLHKKAEFLPREEKYCEKLSRASLNGVVSEVALIIQPIRDSKNTIVNERMSLDHGDHTYKEASSIPIGVPKNAIAGILVSKRLLRQQKQQIELLIKKFPNQYITLPDGELIYEPHKELMISNDSMNKIANEKNVAMAKQKASQDISILEQGRELNKENEGQSIAGK